MSSLCRGYANLLIVPFLTDDHRRPLAMPFAMSWRCKTFKQRCPDPPPPKKTVRPPWRRVHSLKTASSEQIEKWSQNGGPSTLIWYRFDNVWSNSCRKQFQTSFKNRYDEGVNSTWQLQMLAKTMPNRERNITFKYGFREGEKSQTYYSRRGAVYVHVKARTREQWPQSNPTNVKHHTQIVETNDTKSMFGKGWGNGLKII